MYPEIDDRDREIIAAKEAEFASMPGYRVGDYVEFADGITRRISYIWPGDEGKPDSIQTSAVGAGFYLGSGYVNMGNGSLFVGVPADTLTDTGETRKGNVWMFHHDYATAHNAVNFTISFRVFKCSLDAWKVVERTISHD